jgi:hypothetical protein
MKLDGRDKHTTRFFRVCPELVKGSLKKMTVVED